MSGTQVCDDKTELLQEYNNAGQTYSSMVFELHRNSRKATQAEWEQLTKLVKAARKNVTITMLTF